MNVVELKRAEMARQTIGGSGAIAGSTALVTEPAVTGGGIDLVSSEA